MCTGQLLQPAQKPLEIAGMIVTTPLGGDIGMMGKVISGLGLGGRTATAATVATRVIGHYPEYLQVGEAIGAKTFQIPAKIWNSMSVAEQWGANQRFLDRGIREGAEFVMATRRSDIVAGSMLSREVGYLLKNGYQWAQNGLSLILKRH
jgi:hypothetical protein